MRRAGTTERGNSRQDELYAQAVSQHGDPLARLLRGYEADADKRQDLSQEIHFQLWRSLGAFDGRCSLRTWVFRVAHNTAASHVAREARNARALVSLEETDPPSAGASPEAGLDRGRQVETLAAFIRRLKPLDRQVILCYLEGMDAKSIAEITGLSPATVAMKVHRIKRAFGTRFQEVKRDGRPESD